MTSSDLHGQAPDESAAALLLIDVINDLEYDGGDRLLEPAVAMAAEIAALREACAAQGIPAIYVNDNFGRWQSNFSDLIAYYREQRVRGLPIIEQLLPGEHDYDVIKPKLSGFFATPLEVLLTHLGARRVICTGLTTDRCVGFTANDAYMRDFEIYLPADCSACIREEDHAASLDHAKRVLKADVSRWRDLDLASLARDHGG